MFSVAHFLPFVFAAQATFTADVRQILIVHAFVFYFFDVANEETKYSLK